VIGCHLRECRTVSVIPELADQQENREERCYRGRRPPAFHHVGYRSSSVVERG
jgi:hypothetical protein